MEVIYRVFENNRPEFKAELDRVGFPHKYEENIVGKTIFFEISDNNPVWPVISEIMTRLDIKSTPQTKFSEREIKEAHWLSICCTSHFGYPQPEDGYDRLTYDPSDYCPTCGIGGVQKVPFRFKSEPKAKRSSFLQMNWVFDEFFIRPEVRELFEENGITGIDYLPCIHHKNNKILDSIEQLRILSVLPPGLIIGGLNTVTCKIDNEESRHLPKTWQPKFPNKIPHCGRVKYHYPKPGPTIYCENAFRNAPDIIKSFEWFGSGGSAWREVIVSQKVASIILKQKFRGISLTPVLLTSCLENT